MRDKYVCTRCGRPAKEVHHKIHLTPENINDPKIALNPDNLESLCRDCHFEEHRNDQTRGRTKDGQLKFKGECEEGYIFDASGQLVPKKRTERIGEAGG